MHAFQPESFAALSGPKAKAAALALFDSAMLEPAADWRGVAFALHAVVTRKRGAAASHIADDVAMQDAADASEFAPWADYAATGKPSNIARGRVTITFADGWSKTVGMLAGRTAKGRKPWSIAHAVRFAVICYKIAAVRRATGSDNALYHGDVTLDGLVSCPEIVSVISADSSETSEGDLIWNPCEANAATRQHRAGRVDLASYSRPADAPFDDEPCELEAARRAMLMDMGLIPTGAQVLMRQHAIEARERVGALLYPWHRGRNDARFQPIHLQLVALMDADPEGFPLSRETAQLIESERPAADHETMLAASGIVKSATPFESCGLEEFSGSLSAVTYAERFGLVEDALLAWPALDVTEEIADAQAVIEPVTCDHAEADEMPAASEVSGGDQDDADALKTGAAREPQGELDPIHQEADAVAAVELPAPVQKPRYRYSPISGAWEIIPPAGAVPLAA